MTPEFTDDELRTKAWELLQKHLGPVDTLRFLSLMRTKPRDYQKWRDEHFKNLTADELISHLRQTEANRPGS